MEWIRNGTQCFFLVGLYGVFYANPSNDGLDEKDSVSITPYNNDDIQVMQFTGMKDKNGGDIYEGDIVFNGENKYSVEWDPDEFRWVTNLIDPCLESYMCCNYFDSEYVEKGKTLCKIKIIGNIHQNPELLSK